MKKIILIVLAVLSFATFGAEKDVVGIWKTSGGDQVQIIQEGGKFSGKIIMLTEPLYSKDSKEGKEKGLAGKPKIDTLNPDKKQNGREIIGMDFLWGFKYKKGKYVGGKIYDPGSGKTYYCKLKIEGNILEVRGSVDKWGLAGSTQKWEQIK